MHLWIDLSIYLSIYLFNRFLTAALSSRLFILGPKMGWTIENEWSHKALTRCTVPALNGKKRKPCQEYNEPSEEEAVPLQHIFQMGNDPKLIPRIQSALPKTYPLTNRNRNKHRNKLLHHRTTPARPQHIPCNNNNHMFASYIAFPIGHRSLIRLFVGRYALGKVPNKRDYLST